eukprot:gene1901-1866_t
MENQKINTLWTHLHWLSVLAQQGSYTAAAARLGVSKAAMSQRIAELERAAKVTLVQRTTRSLRLTEAGQRLVDETRASFEQIEQSFAQVRDLAEQPSGLLRVTAPVALARQQLVPLMAAFLQDFPDVRIELDLSDRLSALATEGYDLAIRHTARPPDTHVAWALCATESVLVATRAYLRKQGEPQTPAELQAHNCLHYPRSQDTPAWTFEPRQPSAACERITMPVSGNFAANNSEALREAALTGAGIALLPDFSAQAELRKGHLVQVLPDWKPVGAFAETIYAIRPYAPHVPRAVTALVAHLKPEDARAVAEIHVEAWQVAYADIFPQEFLKSLTVASRQAFWAQFLKEKQGHLQVAIDGVRLLGWINTGPCRDQDAAKGDAEIWALYASPAVWSTGVGRQLWWAAQTTMREQAFRRCCLWVLAQNTRAMRFYQAAGFERDVVPAKTMELGGVKGIELVVPFGANGITSQVARYFQVALSNMTGLPVQVAHQHGYTGMKAVEYAERHSRPQRPSLLVAGAVVSTAGVVASPMHNPLGTYRVTQGDANAIERVLSGELTTAMVDKGSCHRYLDQGLSFLVNIGDGPRDGVMLWFACRDPRTPWWLKALAFLVVAYALSPIDLVPDFIPVLGFVDDVILLPVLIWPMTG